MAFYSVWVGYVWRVGLRLAMRSYGVYMRLYGVLWRIYAVVWRGLSGHGLRCGVRVGRWAMAFGCAVWIRDGVACMRYGLSVGYGVYVCGAVASWWRCVCAGVRWRGGGVRVRVCACVIRVIAWQVYGVDVPTKPGTLTKCNAIHSDNMIE